MARDTGADQGIVRSFFPAYRVFIEGIEVTNLVSSVRTNWSQHNPMQCTIELANPESLMTITALDMLTIAQFQGNAVSQTKILNQAETQGALDANTALQIRQSQGISEDQFLLLPSDILGYVAKQNLGELFFEPSAPIPPITSDLAGIKSRVLPKKLVQTYNQSTVGVDGHPLDGELFFKYPVFQGKWIWHYSDRVRVAFRNVSDPTTWYWMHAGTITDINERESEDLQSTLTITSEGVLKDLRNARIANITGNIRDPAQLIKDPNNQNGSIDPAQLSTLESAIFSNFLQNRTLFQVLELMIFGSQSLLDDFGTALKSNLPKSILAERFGFADSKGNLNGDGANVTDAAVKAYQASLRNLNIAGLGDFQRWKGNQGTQVRILGGPLDAIDVGTGEQLQDGLSEWHTLLDNVIKQEDLTLMQHTTADLVGVLPTSNSGGRHGPLTTTQLGQNLNALGTLSGIGALDAVDIESVITQIGTDPDTYPIRQRVLMLLPANLGSNLGRKILDQDLSGCPAAQAEFFDRLSLLQQILDRIDFCLYDSPRGDVVVEFPLYDFEPRHFTKRGAAKLLQEEPSAATFSDAEAASFFKEFTSTQVGQPLFPTAQESSNAAEAASIAANDTARASAAATRLAAFFANAPANIKSQFIDVNYRLPSEDYDSTFCIFAYEQGSIDIASSDQDVKTVWVSTPRYLAASARDQSQGNNSRVVTALPNLIPLYGFRVEQNDPAGNITTADAARVYNHVMLNKANADTMNVRVPALPNWGAWLNRPVFIESRNIILSVKSVNHTIVWQSDCNTDYGLWHAKFWGGLYVTDDHGRDRKLFVPFGGVNSQPYNFAYLLKIDKVAVASYRSTAQADNEAALAQAQGKQ